MCRGHGGIPRRFAATAAAHTSGLAGLPVRAVRALDAQEQQKMSDSAVAAEATQSLQAELRAQEQQKMSDSAVAAEATQSLQAANAALQTKIGELQSQVEAKQKELEALAETLQDSEAKATDATTQLLTAQLKAASEERESMESKLQTAQESMQDLQSQLEAARVQLQQAEASSELETKKQELEASIVAHSEVGQWYPTCESTSADRVSSAQVAAVTEELRASEEKAVKSLPTEQRDERAVEQAAGIPRRFAATAAAHTSGLAGLPVRAVPALVITYLLFFALAFPHVEAKQKELAALAETLQDSEAKATDAATQLLTAQLKVASEERESLESQLHSAQEALQVRESHSKDLQSQLEAARVQQAEASSELEAKKQELEAQVAAVTVLEARRLQKAVKSLPTEQRDEWAAKRLPVRAVPALVITYLMCFALAFPHAQEQQKMSDSAVAAEATQSLQAANAALQTKIDELQSQVEAKQQKELAALEQTLQDGSAHAQQVQSEAACFDISTPRSSKSPWAESPEAAQVAEVAGAEQSGLLAENRLLRERLSAFEEEKATSLQALREQVMLLARENYDLKHGVRQAEASPMEAKEVPAGSGAASEGDQRWWLSAIFSPFLTEGDMREIHAQSRLDEADG
eukprot:s2747_g15.t1